VRYLLDTHVWLRLQADRGRIAGAVRAELAETSAQLMLSAVSSWEIAVKYALGKLPLPEPPSTYVPSRMRHDGVDGLAISHAHTLHVAGLPHHHGDPFDRLLVAQAQLEDLTLVTADPKLTSYDVPVLWAL
jgi:PIN domain nuclease of toxin-antitoxin system